MIVLAGLLVLLLAGLPGQASALTVKNVRFGAYPDKTRLVLDLSEKSDYRVFALADPWRLVVDLPDFSWDAGAPRGKGIVSVRQGSLQPGVSRIIFELQKSSVVRSAFIVPHSGKLPDRLVIDFAPAPEADARAGKDHVFGKLAAAASTATPPPSPAITPPETQPKKHGALHVRPAPETPAEEVARDTDAVSATPLKSAPPPPSAAPPPAPKTAENFPVLPARKPQQTPYSTKLTEKPLIIIDPGHGGVDPGTAGPGGIKEKNVTLAAARALKKELEDTGRYRVMMTRDKDVYLRLYERVDFARQHKGDLFISLHADSIDSRSVGGASIYTLSDKASDAETEKLAMRENRADLIAGVDLSHQDDDVANILVDLAMRDTMNQSRFFANMVAGNMQTHSIRTLERTNRSAGFAVLKDPDVPSILVEMGFLSNRREAQTLIQPAFQHRLAQSLVASINSYFTKVRENNRS